MVETRLLKLSYLKTGENHSKIQASKEVFYPRKGHNQQPIVVLKIYYTEEMSMKHVNLQILSWLQHHPSSSDSLALSPQMGRKSDQSPFCGTPTLSIVTSRNDSQNHLKQNLISIHTNIKKKIQQF